MTTEKIARCPKCNTFYRFMGMYCDDHSLCPACRQALEKELHQADQKAQQAAIRRRQNESTPPICPTCGRPMR